MTLDRNTLQIIVNLPDEQLVFVIKRLAAESGVDISSLTFTKEQLNGIRSALSVATNEDIARANELINEIKQKNSEMR